MSLKESTYAKGPAYLDNHHLKIPFLTEVLRVLYQKYVGR
jgi:hypothetical protein